MDAKELYTLRELFDLLPIPLAELARMSKVNEVTLARVRDGRPTRRATANKLLLTFSKVYDRPLNLYNVTGINLQGSGQEAEQAGERNGDLAVA